MPTQQEGATAAPHWLRDLCTYASQQLATPAGQAALAATGCQPCSCPTGLGYLPIGYLEAVPTAGQDWCRARCPAGGLVQAVIAADGSCIDLQPWQPSPAAGSPAAAAGSSQPIPAESEPGRRWFTAGLVRIGIDSPGSGSVRLVFVRREDRVHRDRFDLSVVAQVRRCAASAGLRCDVPAETLAAALHAAWEQVQAAEDAAERPAPAVPVSDTDRVQALARLRDPQLLAQVADDLTALGWAGDTATKQLLYLTAISRFLPRPVWALYQGSVGAQPWHDLGALVALVPPEDAVILHRVTESQLRQAQGNALRHRLVVIDRAETLRPEAALALRVLHERGSIGWQSIAGNETLIGANRNERDSIDHGTGFATGFPTVQGPIAVIAAAVSPIDARWRDCVLPITADESPAQTARVIAAQSNGTDHRPTVGTITNRQRLHWAMQRLLVRDPVRIPFGNRIVFPIGSVRFRREHALFLSLIEASALVHQYQRKRDADGCILADERDFAHALACAGHLLGQDHGGLSAAGRTVLRCLSANGVEAFTVQDLTRLLPDWTRYAYRTAVAELTDLGYADASPGGRGRERTYHLTPASVAAQGIALLPVGASAVRTRVGELAMVGEPVSPTAMPVGKVG